MFRINKATILALLLIALYAHNVKGQSNSFSAKVSWLFRGEAQQNNTVLTFNMGDTLNLVCLGTIDIYNVSYVMTISRGDTAPEVSASESGSSYAPVWSLNANNAGTLIYDDVNGIQPGFENFVIVTGSYLAAISSGRDFRYIGVGLLQPNDAGTYHCTGILGVAGAPGGFIDFFQLHSGGLTIVVNTKKGQAKSSRANGNQFLTYSALLVAASKTLF